MLDFFNLVFAWNAVPPTWKSSEVVPVFEYGDRTNPDNYRPISLASCAFKVFEHLIHGRIAPHILPVDTLRLRQETHTFCAFIDIRKAFDTAWVEATLVRLAQIGVTGGMWRTITNFLVGTISQVRIGDAHSHPWMDTGIAQGRVLSPLLFNLLVNSLAADIRRCCPGVRLVPASDVRFVCQLYADDVAILAESAEDLQRGLDAVTSWGRKWRFT